MIVSLPCVPWESCVHRGFISDMQAVQQSSEYWSSRLSAFNNLRQPPGHSCGEMAPGLLPAFMSCLSTWHGLLVLHANLAARCMGYNSLELVDDPVADISAPIQLLSVYIWHVACPCECIAYHLMSAS